MNHDKRIFKDEVDFATLFTILFDNFNLLFSIFVSSFLIVSVYYLSSNRIYQSETLLEIKNEKSSFLPDSLSNGISRGISSRNSLDAEVEIYKSNFTIQDGLISLRESNLFKKEDIPISAQSIRQDLEVYSDDNSLLTITYKNGNRELARYFLNLLNDEFINDRTNFARESSIAGKKFISNEIPRIKSLLKEAEDKLNSFKVSTNTSDYIFDTDTRNTKLERLRRRINEIEFKELELKEFYKENHPIYLTLTQQKNLILSQINEIELELPNVPSTQRRLENYKREVETYSEVLKELSEQELSYAMLEASSISNVRIINRASESVQISPSLIIFYCLFLVLFFVYSFLLTRHFLGGKITHLDSLIDYVGKEKILGELPNLKEETSSRKEISFNVAEELLNKTVYEITHSEKEIKSIAVIGSRKGVGKTEIAKRLFNKLKARHKVCLIDLDYRKKGIKKELSNQTTFKTFEEFNKNTKDFIFENDSLIVPSLDVQDPSDFFTSDEFKNQIESLKKEYEYIICDTPPWKLFVDAKIITKYFDMPLYIICNQLSSFQDIDLFLKEQSNRESVRYFYNKFNLYFNFLWYKYQYPYYSRNYYYDYHDYSSLSSSFLSKKLINNFPSFFFDYFSRIKQFLKEKL